MASQPVIYVSKCEENRSISAELTPLPRPEDICWNLWGKELPHAGRVFDRLKLCRVCKMSMGGEESLGSCIVYLLVSEADVSLTVSRLGLNGFPAVRLISNKFMVCHGPQLRPEERLDVD